MNKIVSNCPNYGTSATFTVTSCVYLDDLVKADEKFKRTHEKCRGLNPVFGKLSPEDIKAIAESLSNQFEAINKIGTNYEEYSWMNGTTFVEPKPKVGFWQWLKKIILVERL